jgi:hypothetical protein
MLHVIDSMTVQGDRPGGWYAAAITTLQKDRIDASRFSLRIDLRQEATIVAGGLAAVTKQICIGNWSDMRL